MATQRKTKSREREPANRDGSLATPAYFLSLTLENVRCFNDKQTLDLSDGRGNPKQWTLLLGQNGTGKTTVLQTLDSVCSLLHALQEGDAGATGKFRESFFRAGSPIEECAAGCSFAVGPSLTEAKKIGGSPYVRTEFSCAVSAQSPLTAIHVPHRFGYGGGRRMGSATPKRDRADGPAVTLYSDQDELRDAQDWLLKLDYAANKNSKQRDFFIQRLEQVKLILIDLLPDVTDIRIPTPRAQAVPQTWVEFQTPDGWIPTRQLGYGVQCMIAWVVDFVSRMIECYPDSADPFAEPAVVLIDEIALHLHPSWQRRVIPYLTEHFPNTQFIASANSPLVVQAVGENANLVVLRREGDQVVIDQSAQSIEGWRADQILTSGLFDVPLLSPDLEALMEQRRSILAKGELTASDRTRIAQLEARVGELPFGESLRHREIIAALRELVEYFDKKPGSKR